MKDWTDYTDLDHETKTCYKCLKPISDDIDWINEGLCIECLETEIREEESNDAE